MKYICPICPGSGTLSISEISLDGCALALLRRIKSINLNVRIMMLGVTVPWNIFKCHLSFDVSLKKKHKGVAGEKRKRRKKKGEGKEKSKFA
jgi:hypothetical protein